jgi:trans-L-3-hydroxyproline dehydratase
MSLNWNPPEDWLHITTIDAHTAGEPLRVITGGFPDLPGDTILEKRRHAREHLDRLRTTLMWEPRGHADMYGCIVTEPVTPDGTLGVLFLHNEGFSTMCGHGIIGLAKVGLDSGMIQIEGDHPVIRMDTPAGRVTAFARRKNGRVMEVSFHNVPSFVYASDQVVDVPGVGEVRYDVAFGGAFYAFCQAEEVGVGLSGDDFRQLIDVGMRIKVAVMESLPIRHPFEEDLGFLYGTIFVGEAHEPGHHSRNVCIFADGEVDRCPTGTGVSARAAIHYSRGELGLNEPFAIIPRVTGTAHICGRNELLIDPADPLKDGFILR